MWGLEWEQASNTFVLCDHSEGTNYTTHKEFMFKEVHDSMAIIWVLYRKPQFTELEYCLNLKTAKHSNYLSINSAAFVMNCNVLLCCLAAKQINSPVFIFSSVMTT